MHLPHLFVEPELMFNLRTQAAQIERFMLGLRQHLDAIILVSDKQQMDPEELQSTFTAPNSTQLDIAR